MYTINTRERKCCFHVILIYYQVYVKAIWRTLLSLVTYYLLTETVFRVIEVCTHPRDTKVSWRKPVTCNQWFPSIGEHSEFLKNVAVLTRVQTANYYERVTCNVCCNRLQNLCVHLIAEFRRVWKWGNHRYRNMVQTGKMKVLELDKQTEFPNVVTFRNITYNLLQAYTYYLIKRIIYNNLRFSIY